MTKKYILSSLNIYLLIISTIIYIIGLYTIGIYSTSQTILYTIISIILIIISFLCYINKLSLIYNGGVLITLLLNIVFFYNINNLNENYEYITNIVTKKYSYETYNVYVRKKNTKYSEIESLSNKKIGALNNNSQNTCLYIENLINIECISYDSIENIEKAINEGEIQSFILEEKAYKKLNNNLDIKKQTRPIYQTKIKDTNS